jgi:hypothetical protein
LVERDDKVSPPEGFRMISENIIDVPVRTGLKVVKPYDVCADIPEEDREAYRDFMSWYLMQDFAPLLSLPKPDTRDFIQVQLDQDGHDVSAFNTHDFHRGRGKFDAYGYRLKKVLEKVSDLAIQCSCVSDAEGRENLKRRLKAVLDVEFIFEAQAAEEAGNDWKVKRLMWYVQRCVDEWLSWNPA